MDEEALKKALAKLWEHGGVKGSFFFVLGCAVGGLLTHILIEPKLIESLLQSIYSREESANSREKLAENTKKDVSDRLSVALTQLDECTKYNRPIGSKEPILSNNLIQMELLKCSTSHELDNSIIFNFPEFSLTTKWSNIINFYG